MASKKSNSEEIKYSRTVYIDAHNRESRIASIRAGKLATNARMEPTVASRTLSVCRKDNNYYLQVSDILIADPLKVLTLNKSMQMVYRRYLEAIRALGYNINFVLSIQNYGEKNKNGKTISVKQLKEDNFEYDINILDAYSHSKISHPIKDEKNIAKALAKVLKDSQKFIEGIEPEVLQFKDKIPGFDSLQNLKNQWFENCNQIILSLEKGKTNTSNFTSDICFDELSSQYMHS